MRRSTISATMKKERFRPAMLRTTVQAGALVYRTLSPDCGIALADSKNCADRARLGVRRYCAAFLLLSTICYQLSAISASAQLAPTRKVPRNEPLEKYDNPPALPRKIETSPRMISQYGPFVSYQVNVDANGQNIIGDAANECPISVDPTNLSKMAIAWRQFNSVTSNFRQAGWGYTTDGGTSWTFPGVLENNVFRSDPVLDSGDTGIFFYLSLLETFFDNMWRSLDGGMSWTNIAPAKGGDKEWFTIDNTNSTGHEFQYQAWSSSGNNFGGRQFTRSTDGGFTWLDPVNIPNSPS